MPRLLEKAWRLGTRWFAVGTLAWPSAACGGAQSDARPAAAPAGSNSAPAPPAEGRTPDTPEAKVAGATVYNTQGQSKACDPPGGDCPESRPARDFLDRCRLAGYRVLRCGCELVCSGKVDTERQHYDAQGQVVSCPPPDPACQPPETSAAFQDACNDAGHRLVTCGCTWLCNGPPKR